MSEEKENVTVSVFEKLEQQIKDLGTEEPISEKVLQPVVEEKTGESWDDIKEDMLKNGEEYLEQYEKYKSLRSKMKLFSNEPLLSNEDHNSLIETLGNMSTKMNEASTMLDRLEGESEEPLITDNDSYSVGTVEANGEYTGEFVSHNEDTSPTNCSVENKKVNWEKKSKTTPSTQVWLNETQRSIARVIGEGKISTGIKVALDFYIKNHEVS